MRRPAWGNANTVVMHEMVMMGRVYRTYYDKKGLHHWAIEKEPGWKHTCTFELYG